MYQSHHPVADSDSWQQQSGAFSNVMGSNTTGKKNTGLHSSSSYRSQHNNQYSQPRESLSKKASNPALLFYNGSNKSSNQKENSSNNIFNTSNVSENNSLVSNHVNRSPMRKLKKQVAGQGWNQQQQQVEQVKQSGKAQNTGKNTSKNCLVNSRAVNSSNNKVASSSAIFSQQHTSSSNSNYNSNSQSCLSPSPFIKRQEAVIKESMHFCENHESKLATFASNIEIDHIEYYCEKCAILLASQGYAVNRIFEEQHLQSDRSSSRILSGRHPSQHSSSEDDSLLSHDSSNKQIVFKESKKRRRFILGASGNRDTQQPGETPNPATYNSNNSLNSQNSRNLKANSNSSSLHVQQSQQSQNQSMSSSLKNRRNEEVSGFLHQTEELIQEIEERKEHIVETLVESQEFYGEQMEEINEYFNMVAQSLQLEKNKCYNCILNQRKQCEAPVRQIADMIGQLKTNMQNIVQDIKENIDTVWAADEQVYRLVIQQYQDSYQDIHRKVGSIRLTPVELRKINFQGLPDSIYQLSNLLTESIRNNGHEENKHNLDRQLESLRQSMQHPSIAGSLQASLSMHAVEPKQLFSIKKQSSSNNSNSSNKLCFSFEQDTLKNELNQQRQTQEQSYQGLQDQSDQTGQSGKPDQTRQKMAFRTSFQEGNEESSAEVQNTDAYYCSKIDLQ